ncbi:MAG: protein kinase, partial [Vicinamibacterales bacterium]|nr:protein kinase [Vicinamibacterales bacterium]
GAGVEDRRRRFHHEARAASALHHPHICAVYDVGDAVPAGPGATEPAAGAPSVTFLVMELLEGETLAERLAKGRLPLAQALEIAGQMADALGTAHKAGVIHRDVKPGNVMLTKPHAANPESVHATLLDFGLAKLRAHGARPLLEAATTAPASAPVTVRGMILGTLPYMAPEQVEGREADARTDIWALGAVVYEMVAGARAFAAPSQASLIAAILEHEPEPLVSRQPLTPPALEHVVRKCLAKDPDGRWDSAHDVADELRWIAQDSSGPTAVRQPARRPGRVRARLVAAAASVMIGVAAGVWSLARPILRPGLPEVEGLQLTSGPFNELEPAVSPDGNTVAYVVDEGLEQSIWLVPTRGGPAKRWTEKPGQHRRPAWAPDGRILFESADGDWRGIFAAPLINAAAAVPLVKDGRQPAVSPDGRRLAFVRTAASGSLRIFVADLANLSAERVLTGNADGRWDHRDPSWSPDGRSLCYGAADGLWVVPADGSGRASKLAGDQYAARPVWSDSGHIYYASPREGDVWGVWRVPRAGGAPQLAIASVGSEEWPSLSADRTVLAFATIAEQAEIFIRDLRPDGDRPEEPLGGDVAKSVPAFAPDGAQIYFYVDAYSRSEIWTQRLVSGRPAGAMKLFPLQRPSEPAMICSQMAPSPDGKWLAFMGKQGDAREVYVVSAAGGVPVDVSERPGAADYHPAWSPDSAQLAFVSERDGAQHVWVRPVRNGRPAGPVRRLTTGAEFELWPTWSPDGTRVAFVTGPGDTTEIADAETQRAGAPRLLTAGADSQRVRSSARSGWLVTANRVSGGRFVLQAFDPARRAYVETFPDIDLGRDIGSLYFDISPDERYVALVRKHYEGRIGVMRARSGRY